MEYVIQIQVEQVQQACKGDEKAIEQLYRQYANGMYHICLRMCADSELAKDIFHEAFIKAIGKLTQLRVDEQFNVIVDSGRLAELFVVVPIVYRSLSNRWLFSG